MLTDLLDPGVQSVPCDLILHTRNGAIGRVLYRSRIHEAAFLANPNRLFSGLDERTVWLGDATIGAVLQTAISNYSHDVVLRAARA